jgi:hypothetical protein
MAILPAYGRKMMAAESLLANDDRHRSSTGRKRASMSRSKRITRQYLFLLRLWNEQSGDGRTEWSGKLQRTANGETHFFNGLPSLTGLLATMLPPGADNKEASQESESDLADDGKGNC